MVGYCSTLGLKAKGSEANGFNQFNTIDKMNPLLPPHSPQMPEFILWIAFIAGLIGLASMAWLTLDIIESWQRTRPNQRRKYGTKIKEHKFETSHLDPP